MAATLAQEGFKPALPAVDRLDVEGVPDTISAGQVERFVAAGIAAAQGGQARRPSLISTVMHTVCKKSH